MAVRFKEHARVPSGVTPEQVLAELDDIEARYGKRGVDEAVKAVIEEPERYPALRAFGPASAEEAFREAMREAVTYAVRIIVTVPDDDYLAPSTRVLHVVHDDAGAAVWASPAQIAASVPMRAELIRQLRRDAEAFSGKLRTVLAEIEGLL